VIFKDSEEAIETDIHTRWLNHRIVEWLYLEAARGDLS